MTLDFTYVQTDITRATYSLKPQGGSLHFICSTRGCNSYTKTFSIFSVQAILARISPHALPTPLQHTLCNGPQHSRLQLCQMFTTHPGCCWKASRIRPNSSHRCPSYAKQVQGLDVPIPPPSQILQKGGYSNQRAVPTLSFLYPPLSRVWDNFYGKNFSFPGLMCLCPTKTSCKPKVTGSRAMGRYGSKISQSQKKGLSGGDRESVTLCSPEILLQPFRDAP